jgi:hypothetical protein
LALNLVWTAMQLAVPAPLRMGLELLLRNQLLKRVHCSEARIRTFCNR